MPKIYTKTGDKGSTTLYDMSRVSKADSIFDILGGLDELNVYIGKLCVFVPVDTFLREIQRKLLDIGSDFATPASNKREKIVEISEADIKALEDKIDMMESKLPKLTVFVLPGVALNDVAAHEARVCCRKVEREAWRIRDKVGYVKDETFRYLNRLADFFFVYERYLSCGKEIRR